MQTISYRTSVRLLRRNKTDVYVEAGRAKGSHRLLVCANLDGSKCAYPVPFHGNQTPIPPRMLRDIIERLNLPRKIFAAGMVIHVLRALDVDSLGIDAVSLEQTRDDVLVVLPFDTKNG